MGSFNANRGGIPEKIMKIELTEQELESFLSDVLITALEGGSNYWYTLSESADEKLEHIKREFRKENLATSEYFVKGVMAGESFEILDMENDDVLGEINKESCLKAIQTMIEGVYRSQILSMLNENFDAEDADIFFQFAVIGEIVYG